MYGQLQECVAIEDDLFDPKDLLVYGNEVMAHYPCVTLSTACTARPWLYYLRIA